ncbi:hypothetical protein VTK26DRAFT_3621 [Humicola hyalothermophila]
MAYKVEWLVLDGVEGKRELVEGWRAMLHIDLLEGWRGQGWGRKLIERFVEGVRRARDEEGVNVGRGIQLGVAAENTKVVKFYEKVGFRVYPGGEKEGGNVWMVTAGRFPVTMTARLIVRAIRMLYQTLMEQEKAVGRQEESAAFQSKANSFVDVQGLTGVSMEEAVEQLASARSLLASLYTRLSHAIASWTRLSISERQGEGLPWLEFPFAPPPGLSAAPEEPRRTTAEGRTPRPGPRLTDPAVGTRARYHDQWKAWQSSPKVDHPSINLDRNTPWWMHEQTHYALLQPIEQDPAVSSGRAAQFNRGYDGYTSFHRDLRNAREQLAGRSATGPSEAGPACHDDKHSYCDSKFECQGSPTVDTWADNDFDAEFWQKNLRPGNIWTEAARRNHCDEFDFSPRTRPPASVSISSKPPRNWRGQALPRESCPAQNPFRMGTSGPGPNLARKATARTRDFSRKTGPRPNLGIRIRGYI